MYVYSFTTPSAEWRREACWAHNPEVGGSKPPSATYNFFYDWPIFAKIFKIGWLKYEWGNFLIKWGGRETIGG